MQKGCPPLKLGPKTKPKKVNRPTLKRLTTRIVTVIGSTPETINPCVVVPQRIVATLKAESGKNQSIPVRATLQGTPFEANVVRYRGAWRLYLNGSIRKAAERDVGHKVTVTLLYDPKPRVIPLPPAFLKALDANPKARATFESLAPSRRKEMVRYLAGLKNQETLERNVGKAIRSLGGSHAGVPVALRISR